MNTEHSHLKKAKGIILFIAAIVAIPTLYYTIKNDKYAHSGVLAMYMADKEVNNNDERSVFIFVSSSSEPLSDINITPHFNNVSKYPIHDFDLQYYVESTGFLPQANTLYDRIPLEGHTCLYKYRENTLYQFAEVHHPFSPNSFPRQNGHYTVKARATYAGALPYNYLVNIWVRLVPRDRNQTNEQWQHACHNVLKKISTSVSTYDVYYCSNGMTVHRNGAVNTPPAAPAAKTEYATQMPSKQEKTKKLKITSHERRVEGDSTYLYITFNQPLSPDTSVVVTFFRRLPKPYYKARTIRGTGTNTARIHLPYNDDGLSAFSLPHWDDSFKENVRFDSYVDEQTGMTYLRLTNTDTKPVLVEVHLKNGKIWWCPIGCISEGRTTNFLENLNPEDVSYYRTSRIRKCAPYGAEIIGLIFLIAMVVIMFGGAAVFAFMFYWLCIDDIRDIKRKRSLKWSDIELEWIIFPIFGIGGFAIGIYYLRDLYLTYFI